MRYSRTLAIVAVLFLAACADGDRFGGAGGDGIGATGGLGSPSDPASPAYFQQSVGDRVFFEVNQSTLNASARVTLDEQAQWLLDNPDYSAIIEGHADERGTTEYNIALGARRASAVQEYLFSQGVALGRLQTVSFGKERPVEICSDEICYARNRRGVTVLTAAAGV
jgi:peptidoglycan-associated lipoprotein